MYSDKDMVRETWETPKLKVFGNIEDITAQIQKKLGPDDGLVFIINAPITIGS